MATRFLVLVDKDDNEIGIKDKLDVHKLGLLHRAFSVFIFNSRGRLLLQQRADTKYHSPRLWTNTCCSHPRNTEIVIESAKKRLYEEMKVSCNLNKLLEIRYKADVGGGMIENEYLHIFYGRSNIKPEPDPKEVQDYSYKSMDVIEKDLEENPDKYTEWFKITFPRVKIALEETPPK